MRLSNLWLLLILLGMISYSFALNGECTVRRGNRRVRICCKGYIKVRTGCEPYCSKGCENGICTKPEMCECSTGYALNATGVCDPVCTSGCPNGRCVAPETCKCNEGYLMSAPNVCDPVLTTTLLASSFDNDDDSNDDYGDNGKARGEAEYRCNHLCIHGTCHGENCMCDEGYELQSQEGKDICVAIIPAGTGVLKSFH